MTDAPTKGTRITKITFTFTADAALEELTYELNKNGVTRIVEVPEFFVIHHQNGSLTALDRKYIVAFSFTTEEFDLPVEAAEATPDTKGKVVSLDEVRKAKAKRKLQVPAGSERSEGTPKT